MQTKCKTKGEGWVEQKALMGREKERVGLGRYDGPCPTERGALAGSG